MITWAIHFHEPICKFHTVSHKENLATGIFVSVVSKQTQPHEIWTLLPFGYKSRSTIWILFHPSEKFSVNKATFVIHSFNTTLLLVHKFGHGDILGELDCGEGGSRTDGQWFYSGSAAGKRSRWWWYSWMFMAFMCSDPFGNLKPFGQNAG
ncbi:hypothetical protein NPIL_540211 [Nephila pilipes]|uniref:Uncharacterized protein n=1 Tax=Nephila pilipes TaxID=299642 RepID=A0A8X6N3N4_NEPPI|nr:hypothetical protein NPIL_540211 [Nephila pilipes]